MEEIQTNKTGLNPLLKEPARDSKRKRYFVRTPWWLKKLYPARLWNVDTKKNILYLSFDDGPHPEATPFVLNELKKQNALATFFCIGKNILQWPEIYRRILDEGHTVGNHTQNHLNGWKVNNEVYMKDIAEAANYIDSDLFRPPYGRMTSFQASHLRLAMRGRKPRIVMWDVLSADFDATTTAENCLENVIFKSKPGSIIVFHDSEKAYSKLQYCLPKILQFLSEKGCRFDALKGIDEDSRID